MSLVYSSQRADEREVAPSVDVVTGVLLRRRWRAFFLFPCSHCPSLRFGVGESA